MRTRIACLFALLCLFCTSIASADYPAAVMSLSPIAYWRMDDIAGPTITEYTGNYNGTLHGTATFGVTGLLANDLDTAMQFNTSISNYITAATNLPTGHDYTFVAILKLNAAHAATDYIVSAAGVAMAVYKNGIGWSGVTGIGNAYGGNFAPANQLPNGRSVFVSVKVHDTSTCSATHTSAWYSVNGTAYVADGSGGSTNGSCHSTQTYIAYSPPGFGNINLNGVIDEVIIYNYLLTNAQILGLYNQAVAANLVDPGIGAWR